jgi:hypothetical protein
VSVVLPEGSPLRAETYRSDSVNKVVLLITMCISRFLCEIVILVQEHDQDKGSWLGLLF